MKLPLEVEQSVDQAGFRLGFSTDNHLFPTTMLSPIGLGAGDVKKGFDSVKHEELWGALLGWGWKWATLWR